MQPGAQYCTRQRFPPSYSCITPDDNACAFFKPASPEGRHLFPPVLTLLIYSKMFFIDTELSLTLEGSYHSYVMRLFYRVLQSVGVLILTIISLDFYSAVILTLVESRLGWAWSSWGRSPEVTVVCALSGCCVTISFILCILFPHPLTVLNFCFRVVVDLVDHYGGISSALRCMSQIISTNVFLKLVSHGHWMVPLLQRALYALNGTLYCS